MILFLLFLSNIASCVQLFHCPDIFIDSADGLPLISAHTHLGLFMTYNESPKKRPQCDSNFCFLQYSANHERLGRRMIEVDVNYCCFSEPQPAFVVKKVHPDWVECVNPLLFVECKEKPMETQTCEENNAHLLEITTLSKARVANNTVKYPLPFVEGENPQLQIQCESHKATIVFDFGPDNKKSTTIDFLHLALNYDPPLKRYTYAPEMVMGVRELLRQSKRVYACVDFYEKRHLISSPPAGEKKSNKQNNNERA